jgi:hypothetical protein
MYRFLVIALLALPACAWHRGMRDSSVGGHSDDTAVIVTGGSVIITGPLITIDEDGTLCGPENPDPQHSCP